MPRENRWIHEGDDAAVLAKAILDGTVTEELPSFKAFFSPDGPGGEIGLKYLFHTPKGERNLKLNWKKLCRKIKVWKSGQPDPDTGKSARFSERFLKKAGFPSKPELLSDVPPEQNSDFVPGRDQLFEEIIQEEREEAEDSDSLTVIEAGGAEVEEESHKEPFPPLQTPVKMPAKIKFPSVTVPNKQPGQCDVSWEALRPVFAFIDVEDPSMKRRKAHQTRRGITIRVDIPSGIAISSFMPEISADGTTVIFSGYLEQSRCDPAYTCGALFNHGEGVALGMTTALQEYWTNVIDQSKKNAEGGDPKEYKEYALKLPEPCERDLRDPCNKWEVNDINELGIAVVNRNIRSDFYFMSLFTIASKNFTPAMASRRTLSHMEEVTCDNPMNSTNLARFAYENRFKIDGGGETTGGSRKKNRDKSRDKSRHRRRGKSRHRRRSRSESPDLTKSLRNMSISVEHDDSTIESDRESRRSHRTRRSSKRGSRRSRTSNSNHYDESESQYRHRVKGKQQRLMDSFQKETEEELDGMTMEELEQRSRDLSTTRNRRRREKEDEANELRAEQDRAARAEALRILEEERQRENENQQNNVAFQRHTPNVVGDEDNYSRGSRSHRTDPEQSLRTRRTRHRSENRSVR